MSDGNTEAKMATKERDEARARRRLRADEMIARIAAACEPVDMLDADAEGYGLGGQHAPKRAPFEESEG